MAWRIWAKVQPSMMMIDSCANSPRTSTPTRAKGVVPGFKL